MAKLVANVNIAVDTFNGWVTKTNVLLDALTNEIVTANTQANGSLTTGNSFVIGIFGSNTVCVPTQLRGGNVQSSNTLNITSDVIVGNTFTINSSATSAYLNTNTHIRASNAHINATSISLLGNTLSISSNTTTFTSNTIVVDGVNINSNLILRSDVTMMVAANSDIGVNIVSPVLVFYFDKATFSSGKLTAQTKKGSNTQLNEVIVVHDTTTNAAHLTVYGTVRAPATANLGVYSITSNATHVLLNFTQTQVSTAVKIIANLIK